MYRNLVDQDACRIVIAHGRDNATGALRVLEQEGFHGVLATIDADFVHLERTGSPSDNLLVTDLHDLECMMMASPAFAKVLSEYAVSSRLEAFEKRAGCSLATALAKNAMTVGYLRWLSLRQNLGLDFEGLSFAKFLARLDLRVDVRKLIVEVKNHSQKPALDESETESRIESLRDVNHDPWQVSCGHDILAMLSFALRRTIAARQDLETRPEALERALRLAYERSHFTATELYKSVRLWESANPSYTVLWPVP